ncbi:MAG TPA: cytochrome c biogenesis protein CcdA [Symbiobacteriaceae bacterium]|nr:cytochrome c biogenesis protein CcdA [Symbiobacteriaceae bacterium]
MIAAAIAFTAGLLSFLSPCIVPMLSVYFTMITGQSFRDLQNLSASAAVRQGVLRSTLAFVLGFGVVFTAAGAAAAQAGALFERSLGVLNVVGGLFVVGLGLTMVGVIPQSLVQRLTLGHRDLGEAPRGPRIWSAFLVGLFFAVACSHCIAPTLYAVLLYAGGTGSPLQGALLMGAFSLGLAIPYLLAGLFLGRTVSLLKRAAAPRRWVQWAAGLLMIGLGIIMLAGKLTALTALAARLWPFRLPIGM